MKKVLFFTTTDDRMSKGCALLIYSLKKHIPNFDDYDMKVVYNNLSDDNKKMISDVHSEVIFEKPFDTEFCKNIPTLYGNNNQDTYLCFDSFRQLDYDKVVVLDSDMLCVGDFSELWLKEKFNKPLIACHKSGLNRRNVQNSEDGPIFQMMHNGKFNAGFFVIGKEYLKDYKVYNDLVSITKKRSNGKIYNDQDAIVEYWVGGDGTKKGWYVVPAFYNYREFGVGPGPKEFEPGDKLFRKVVDETKIIHYSGKRKPWGNITDRSKDNGRFDVCSIADPMLMNHSLAMHTWHNYYKECFGEWCKTDWYKIKEKV